MSQRSSVGADDVGAAGARRDRGLAVVGLMAGGGLVGRRGGLSDHLHDSLGQVLAALGGLLHGLGGHFGLLRGHGDQPSRMAQCSGLKTWEPQASETSYCIWRYCAYIATSNDRPDTGAVIV